MYEGTWESVGTHQVPDLVRRRQVRASSSTGASTRCRAGRRGCPTSSVCSSRTGPSGMLRENPYAEWYLNSMQIKGSPTQLHHARVYGDDYPYDNFVKTFNDASAGADLERIAELARRPAPATSSSPPSTTTGSRCGPRPSRTPSRASYHAVARPRRRSDRGRAGQAHAHGPLLLGRLRLALQRRRALEGGRRRARRAHGRPYVHYVTAHCASSSTATSRPCCGTTSAGRPTADCPSCSPTTTTRRRRGRQRPLAGVRAGPQRGHRRLRARHGRAAAGGLAVHPRAPQAPHLRHAEALRLPDARVRRPADGVAAEVGAGAWRRPLLRSEPPRGAAGHRRATPSSSRCSATSWRRTGTC